MKNEEVEKYVKEAMNERTEIHFIIGPNDQESGKGKMTMKFEGRKGAIFAGIATLIMRFADLTGEDVLDIIERLDFVLMTTKIVGEAEKDIETEIVKILEKLSKNNYN